MIPPDHAASTRPAPERPSGMALARDVILLGWIWGASVVLQRLALAEVPPLPLVTLRLLAAVVLFVPFFGRLRRGLRQDPRLLPNIALSGALNPGASAILSALALEYGSSGLLAVLASLAPLLSALLVLPLADEPAPGRRQLGGLGLAFGGVAVLVATRSTGLGAAHDGDPRGAILGLLVACVLALSAVYTRLRLKEADPFAVAGGQMAAGLLFVLPAQLVAGGRVAAEAVSAQAWAAILLSGGIGLGASFIYLLGMIQRHGPTGALLMLYVVPLAAAGLGVLLLGEQVTAPMLVGGGLILGGLLLFTTSSPDRSA